MSKVIIISTLIILIVGGVVGYFVLYGKDGDLPDAFSNFGFGNEPTFEPIPSTVDTAPVDQSGRNQGLRQLTTRPVIGAAFVQNGIQYAEQGTGHIYHIAFPGGSESLISGTTFPRASRAIFSPTDGKVAITSEANGKLETVVGSLIKNGSSADAFVGKTLPDGATEVEFSTRGDFVYYLLPQTAGANGYSYDLQTDTSSLLFTSPLSDVQVLWGESVYVYTTPSASQQGAVYEATKNGLQYGGPSGFGLMAERVNEKLVITSRKNTNYMSQVMVEGASEYLDFTVIPEKCVAHPVASSTAFCAFPSSGLPEGFPESWYQGTAALADSLFMIDVTGESGSFITNLSLESGRDIDVLEMGTNSDGTYLYFINKNDGSLWMYDLTLLRE